MTNADAWIPRTEAARILNLSLRQVHRLVRAGHIQISRDLVTGKVYYFRVDVENLAEERARTGAGGSA